MKRVLVQSHDPDQGSRLHDFFVETIDKTGVSCDNLVRLGGMRQMSKGTALRLCQVSILCGAFAYATSSPWFFVGCVVAGLAFAGMAGEDPSPEYRHGRLTLSDRLARLQNRPFDKKG